MDKYVIIDREFIEGRIETLEKDVRFYQKENNMIDAHKCLGELEGLKEILTQTTPLIPEIVKSFNAGERYGWDAVDGIGNLDRMKEIIPLVSLETYVSDLKI